MPLIFVSYRRSDAPGHAGRLYDQFVARFGAASVFKDLDSIEPGADFVEVIERTVARCDALIAVIGRDWLAASEQDMRRLDDPRDWVRLEIAHALARGIRVIPVLVRGARMPDAAELPDDLKPLARRHSVELAESTWAVQVDQLVAALAKTVATEPIEEEDFGRRVGDYVVGPRLGSGGFADVFLARHVRIQRLVALKELRFGARGDVEAAERFLGEAKIASSLDHPNIVVVHDYFESDGAAYIAMQCYPRGPVDIPSLTLPQRFGLVDGLLAGLAHAGERNVVHRDLKPQNLLVSDDGRIKIVDFGIAKALDATADLGLSNGKAVGTPTFIAPEQALKGEVSPRTDLYSVGVIAFWAFTGQLPFDPSLPSFTLAYQHVHKPAPRAEEIAARIEPRLADWLDSLLAKAPARRPESARVAQAELRSIAVELLGAQWQDEADLTLTGPAESFATAPASDGEHEPERIGGPSRTALALVGASIAILVVAVLIAKLAGFNADDPSPPPTSPSTSKKVSVLKVGDGEIDAVAPVGADVWVAYHDSVFRVDPRTGRRLDFGFKIPASSKHVNGVTQRRVDGMIAGDGALWVLLSDHEQPEGGIMLDNGSRTLYRLGTRDGTMSRPIKLPTYSGDLAYSRGAVWLTAGSVLRVDTDTLRVTTVDSNRPAWASIQTRVVTSGADVWWAGRDGLGEFLRRRGTSDKIRVAKHAAYLDFTVGGGMAWTLSGNTLEKIDLRDGRAVARIDADSSSKGLWFAGGALYVTRVVTTGKDEIARFAAGTASTIGPRTALATAGTITSVAAGPDSMWASTARGELIRMPF